MNQYDLKKLPLEIVTKAKKIIVETSKDLYNNVVDYVAADVQNSISQQKYKELPIKSAIAISGQVCNVRTFEELEENLGKENAVNFLPITASLNAWKKMNEKTELGPLIKEKVDQFKDSKEVYMQVGSLTVSEKLERAKKLVNLEEEGFSFQRPGSMDFEPLPIPPSKGDKILDDYAFSKLKKTLKERLEKLYNKTI